MRRSQPLIRWLQVQQYPVFFLRVRFLRSSFYGFLLLVQGLMIQVLESISLLEESVLLRVRDWRGLILLLRWRWLRVY